MLTSLWSSQVSSSVCTVEVSWSDVATRMDFADQFSSQLKGFCANDISAFVKQM